MSLFGSSAYDVNLERPDDVPFEEQLRGLEAVVKAGKVLGSAAAIPELTAKVNAYRRGLLRAEEPVYGELHRTSNQTVCAGFSAYRWTMTAVMMLLMRHAVQRERRRCGFWSMAHPTAMSMQSKRLARGGILLGDDLLQLPRCGPTAGEARRRVQ